MMKKIWFMLLAFLLFACKPSTREAQTTGFDPIVKSAKVALPANGFSCGYLDNSRMLWFGSNGGGLYRFDGQEFKSYGKKEGLGCSQVYDIIEDHDNNLIVGTLEGLYRFNGNRFMHQPLPFQDTTGLWHEKVYPILSPNSAYSLACGTDQDIWIGTSGGGAYCYNGIDFRPYLREIGAKQEDGLNHNWVSSITNDKEGNLWFASMTHGGASRYDGENFTHFGIKDGLSDDMVRTVFCDRGGNVWFGFNGNRNSGLTFFNGLTFKTFPLDDRICSKNILAIYEDKEGRIWFGGDRGNLCIYENKEFTEFKTSQGNTFESILFILEDANRNIWFGGQSGLWMSDGNETVQYSK